MTTTTNTTSNTNLLGGATMSNTTGVFEKEYNRIMSMDLPQEEKDARLGATLNGFKGSEIVLSEQHQVIRMLEMCKKDWTHVYSFTISDGANDSALEVKRMDLGVITRGCNVVDGFEISTINGGSTIINNFTKDFVTVTADTKEINTLADIGKYNEDHCTCYGLLVRHAGAKTKVLLPRINSDDKVYYVDWKTRKVTRPSAAYTNYMFLASSASGDRNNRAVFFRCKYTNDIALLLATTTLGAYGIMMKKYLGLPVSEIIELTKDGTMLKGLGRIGQALTGSLDFGKLYNVARFTEDFETEQVKEILDDNLNVIDTVKVMAPTGDGKNWIHCDEAARLFSNYFTEKFNIKFSVLPVACIGIQMQAGPGACMVKGSTIVVDHQYMKMVWNNTKDKFNWEHYATDMTRDEFNDSVPMFIFEGTTDKAEFNYDEINFEFKKVAKRTEDVTTSGQIQMKLIEEHFLSGKKDKSKYIVPTAGMMNNTIKEYTAKVDKTADLSVKTVGVNTDSDVPYIDDLMVALDPSIKDWYAPIKSKRLSQMENSILRDMNKQKYVMDSPDSPVKSSFTMLTTEDSKICGLEPLLHLGELFNSKMSKIIMSDKKRVKAYVKEKNPSKHEVAGLIQEALAILKSSVVYDPSIKEVEDRWYIPCVGFRYPTPGNKHCLRGARFVTYNCMAKRAGSKDDPRLNSIKKLSDRSTMMSEDDNVMSILEGADFDGDTILTVTNKDVVNSLCYDENTKKYHYEVVNDLLNGSKNGTKDNKSNLEVTIWTIKEKNALGTVAVDSNNNITAFKEKNSIVIGNITCKKVVTGNDGGYMYSDDGKNIIVTGLDCKEYIKNISDERSSLLAVQFGPNKAMCMYAQKQTGYGTGLRKEDVLADKTGIFTWELENIYYALTFLTNDQIRDLMKIQYGIEEFGTDDYESIEPLFIRKDGNIIEQHVITEDAMNKAFFSMTKVDWNNNANIAMLRQDIFDIYTAYQGVIIDSVKKMIVMKLRHFFSMFVAEQNIAIEIKHDYIDRDKSDDNKDTKDDSDTPVAERLSNKAVSFVRNTDAKVKKWSEAKDPKKRKVLVKTLAASLQLTIANKLADILNKKYAAPTKLSNSMKVLIDNYRDNLDLVDDIVSLRYMYNDCMTELIESNKLTAKIADEDEKKSSKLVNSEIFNGRMDMLNRTVHWYAKKYGVDTKTLLGCALYVNQLIGISGDLYHKNRTTSEEVTSTFAMNVARDEMSCMLNRWSNILRPTTRVIFKGDMEVGEYAMFINGMSGNTMVADPITEVGKLVDIDGSLFIECARELKVNRSFANKTAYVAINLFKGVSVDSKLPLEIRFQEKAVEEKYTYTALNNKGEEQVFEDSEVGFAVMQGGKVIGMLTGSRRETSELRKSLIGRIGTITDIVQFTDVNHPKAIVEMTITKVIRNAEEAASHVLNSIGVNDDDCDNEGTEGTTEDNSVINNTDTQEEAKEINNSENIIAKTITLQDDDTDDFGDDDDDDDEE